MRFGRKTRLGHLVDQFELAVERLHRLFHASCDVLAKCRVIQRSVWPFAFYGTLCTAPGATRMKYLRGNAARGGVGRYQIRGEKRHCTCCPECKIRKSTTCRNRPAISTAFSHVTLPWQKPSCAEPQLTPATAVKEMVSCQQAGPGLATAAFPSKFPRPKPYSSPMEQAGSSHLQDTVSHRWLVRPCSSKLRLAASAACAGQVWGLQEWGRKTRHGPEWTTACARYAAAWIRRSIASIGRNSQLGFTCLVPLSTSLSHCSVLPPRQGSSAAICFCPRTVVIWCFSATGLPTTLHDLLGFGHGGGFVSLFGLNFLDFLAPTAKG